MGPIFEKAVIRLVAEHGPGAVIELRDKLRVTLEKAAKRTPEEVKVREEAFRSKWEKYGNERSQAKERKRLEWDERKTFCWLGESLPMISEEDDDGEIFWAVVEVELAEKIQSIGRRWWAGERLESSLESLLLRELGQFNRNWWAMARWESMLRVEFLTGWRNPDLDGPFA